MALGRLARRVLRSRITHLAGIAVCAFALTGAVVGALSGPAAPDRARPPAAARVSPSPTSTLPAPAASLPQPEPAPDAPNDPGDTQIYLIR